MKRILLVLAAVALISMLTVVSFALLEQIDVTFGCTPTMDGIISSGEWDDANWVTFATSGGTCTVYFKHDGASLYVAFDVPNKDASSGVQVFVDTLNDKASDPQTDDYRFTIQPDATMGCTYGQNNGTGTGWSAPMTDCDPHGTPCGWYADYQEYDTYWTAEFEFPYEKLGITAGEAKTIGIAFCNCWAASDYYWPSGGDWRYPSTWGAASSSDNWALDVTFGCTPSMDGIISSGEWDDANWVTFATSGGTCTVYFKHDGASLYVAFDVPNLDANSGVQVFVDTLNDKASDPQTDDYRFTISRRAGTDEYGENNGTGTGWTAWNWTLNGWTGNHTDLASTWNAEFSISYERLNITAGVAKTIGIAFCNCWAASDYYWPSGGDWRYPSTWGAASSSDNWARPVGGVWVPVDKFGLLAPYIGLASTIMVATAATAIYVKRRKKKQ